MLLGTLVNKDPPQHDASAGIYSQVTALAFQLRQVADQWLGRGNSIVHLVTPRCKNGPSGVGLFTFSAEKDGAALAALGSSFKPWYY
jgi:hypothetical protein